MSHAVGSLSSRVEARPLRETAVDGPPGRGGLRRARRRGRDHRMRGGPRRRHPGVADGPRRGRGLRVGDLVEVLKADPRRTALSPATRLPPGLRGPPRASAPAGQRTPPGPPAAVSDPAARPRRRGEQRRGQGVLDWRCGSTTSPAASASASATAGSTRPKPCRTFPSCARNGLAAAFLYWDAQADDARLTLAVARTAAAHGAVVANHAPVARLLDDGHRLTGARLADGTEIRAEVVVNAGGVWSEEVANLAATPTASPVALRPAKGIHVTVPADRLPCDFAAALPVPGDQRAVFVVPWAAGEAAGRGPGAGRFTYIGTTDTDYDGPLDAPALHRRGHRLSASGRQRAGPRPGSPRRT